MRLKCIDHWAGSKLDRHPHMRPLRAGGQLGRPFHYMHAPALTEPCAELLDFILGGQASSTHVGAGPRAAGPGPPRARVGIVGSTEARGGRGTKVD